MLDTSDFAASPSPASATPATGAPQPRRSWRLSFPDTILESEFLAAHRADAAPIARRGTIIALLLSLAFMWQDTELSATGYRATNIRIYLIVPLCLGIWYWLGLGRAQRHVEWIVSGFILLYAALIAVLFREFEPGFYGISGAVAEGNFIMILLAAFTLSYLRLKWALLVGAAVLGEYLFAVHLWSKGDFSLFMQGHYANALMAYALGAVTCAMFEGLRRRQFAAARALRQEKERYKNLLYTLVPSQIASRIEGGEFPIADSQAEVAILFSDIVGFTELTKLVAPRTLVQLLNELFSEFDLAAERHGVEKIKTIGDGYMAVCGPPVDEQQRSPSVLRFAREMLEITQRMSDKYALPLAVRIGIHNGSLVAGVIGRSRYTYDMWGESVNMASRMESSGVAGRIQVSEPAHQRLKAQFHFEPRGEIEVKGIGPVKAYLLKEPGEL
jgi:adenylate cyclase